MKKKQNQKAEKFRFTDGSETIKLLYQPREVAIQHLQTNSTLEKEGALLRSLSETGAMCTL